jgi:hypothetical protein
MPRAAALIAALAALSAQSLAAEPKAIMFARVQEPKEGALSLLVPRGWKLSGGAIRILDPRVAGANNMVDCKFDMSVSDPAGKVMIRWLPEMLCIDQSQAWGNPEGAVFNEFLVRRKRDPRGFILELAIPYAHPKATGVSVVSGKAQPSLAAKYEAAVDPALAAAADMGYQAYVMEYTYLENGVKYQERMTAVIEDYGARGGGLWKNRGCMLIRAPAGRLPDWEAVLGVIQNSGDWSPSWVIGELKGQRDRSGKVQATQAELRAMENAIAESRRATNAEINKDMYLTLSGRNEYKDPFSGKIETDTDAWKNRWVDSSGNVIYSDDPAYDPNRDPELKVSGFKLSKPRK